MGGQSYASAALPTGKTRYPLYRRLGGQGRSGRMQKISPPPPYPQYPLHRSLGGPQLLWIFWVRSSDDSVCSLVATHVRWMGQGIYIFEMWGIWITCLCSLLFAVHIPFLNWKSLPSFRLYAFRWRNEIPTVSAVYASGMFLMRH